MTKQLPLVNDASAWTGAEFENDESWIYTLSADDAEELTLVDGEVHRVDGGEAAEADRNPVELEQGGHHVLNTLRFRCMNKLTQAEPQRR